MREQKIRAQIAQPITVLLLVLFLTSVSASERAFGDTLCRKELSPEMIEGSLLAIFSPFRMNYAGRRSYVGEGGQARVTIEHTTGDTYWLRDLPQGIPNMQLQLVGPDEPDWRFSDDPRLFSTDQIEGNDSEALEEYLRCDLSEFPRLSGTVRGRTGDATVMYYVRLIVLTDDFLLGAYGWEGLDQPAKLVGVLQLVDDRSPTSPPADQ